MEYYAHSCYNNFLKLFKQLRSTFSLFMPVIGYIGISVWVRIWLLLLLFVYSCLEWAIWPTDTHTHVRDELTVRVRETYFLELQRGVHTYVYVLNPFTVCTRVRCEWTAFLCLLAYAVVNTSLHHRVRDIFFADHLWSLKMSHCAWWWSSCANQSIVCSLARNVKIFAAASSYQIRVILIYWENNTNQIRMSNNLI